VSINIKRNHRLSPEYVLLGFLYQNPSHGYELHERLTHEFGYIWHVSQSQTYNILKRLEDQEFITSTIIEQEKLPARQLLHLTKSGESHFMKWLETPTKCSVHLIRLEFITRLYFYALYYPNKIDTAIREQVAEVSLGLNQLEAMRVELPEDQRYNRLSLDLRIRLLESVLNWLNVCREEFINLKR
jgi:DNA-binding PadR family transcriptional regulator